MTAAAAVDSFLDRRPALLGLAYRMLGSRSEAEDVVQDAWIRWDQYPHRDRVEQPGAFLMQMVTRLCIDRYRAARNQREVYAGPWLPEPVITPSHGPGQVAESAQLLGMGILHLMETLTPLERAVFVLAEGFDYSAREIGETVQRKEAHCRQLLRRARQKLAREGADPGAQPAAEAPLKVVEALTRGDVSALLVSLSPDVELISDGGGKVAAASQPLSGLRAVTRFLQGIVRANEGQPLRVEPACINGAPGVLLWRDQQLDTVMVMEAEGDLIRRLYFVRNPEKLAGADPADGRAFSV